jgi:signal transduction histidine kinase
MNPSYSFAISLIVMGWLYFPIRQWVWTKLFHRKRNSLEEWIPLLVGRFMHVGHGSDQHVWEKVLNDVFRPLSIEVKQQDVTQVKVTGDGVCLLTPCLDPECGVELYYADKGRRLFNRDDISLAQALFNITEQAMAQQENYKHGMLEERKRIMRDLHDDIGGRLLTLMHAEKGESGAAGEALKSLREIIYSLDTEQQITLNISVAKWRIEAMERCEQANIAFEWRWEELEKDINLAPRQHLNLTLIMREGLSNMLRHAKAERNMVDLHVEEGVLQVTLMNDGGVAGSEQIKLGKGLRNMRARTEELGGEFRYTYEAGVFCVKFSVPVNEREGVVDA